MLLVGVAGRDSAEEIRDRLAELGAVSCDQGARPAWDVSDPAIVVIDGAAGAGRERWAGLHLVIGRAGQPDEEQAVDAWLDPGSPAGPAARETDVLWAGRLVPFEANLRAGRRAPRPRWPGPPAGPASCTCRDGGSAPTGMALITRRR